MAPRCQVRAPSCHPRGLVTRCRRVLVSWVEPLVWTNTRGRRRTVASVLRLGQIVASSLPVCSLIPCSLSNGTLIYIARYGRPEDLSPDLFGISLYQQKSLELRPEGRHRFNARSVFSTAGLPDPNTPFLSQIPCSWGAVYFPEHWREFHEYLSVRLAGTHPDLPISSIVAPGLRSNKWTRSWKKYFIELVFLRGYVMLYPNYEDYVSLSTNHLELGSHVKVAPPDVYERKKKLFLLPLLQLPVPDSDLASSPPTGLLDLPAHAMPAWEGLPVTDLFGLLATSETLKVRGALRRKELFECPETTVISSDIRDLLCFSETDDLGE